MIHRIGNSNFGYVCCKSSRALTVSNLMYVIGYFHDFNECVDLICLAIAAKPLGLYSSSISFTKYK